MKRKKILVVEDEGVVAADIKESLKSLGYEVSIVVPSGEEALKNIEDKKPDLVLMDIVLDGKMNGIEATNEIHSRFDIPVVYLTAYADDEMLERAKVTKPFGYIIKPFEDRELHTIIEMALYKHKVEKKLKESEEWLSTTLRSIGDAVIATDSKGGVKFMNDVAQSLTGWKEDDAIGKALEKVFHIVNEETGKEEENPAKKALRNGAVVDLVNHTLLIAKDGTKRSITDSCAPIRDKGSNILGIVLVFRDVTEKKKMEDELMKTRKIESIGVLAGGIAHDFNNLLTGILGNVSLAKMYAKKEDQIFQFLDNAEKASLRAKDLTQQLLTFSKGGAPIKRTASIAELVRDSADFAVKGAAVKCEFSFPDDLWAVEVDSGQISAVINNLIINADQAMPEGGIIEVSAENIAISTKNALPLNEGNYVRISIKDHGIGIPKRHLKKIFDPYFSTKKKGSGLGLATSYSIVKKHRGCITVKSEITVGTTFYIYLSASQKEITVKKDEKEIPLIGKGKILVMDDEDMVIEAADLALKSMGYEVEIAKDGSIAIELYKKAKESGNLFDAVIMDLTIPGGMGGKEAIKKVLEIDPKAKVIVSSGYSNDPVMADFRKYGFISFLTKPYKPAKLHETLVEVLQKKE